MLGTAANGGHRGVRVRVRARESERECAREGERGWTSSRGFQGFIHASRRLAAAGIVARIDSDGSDTHQLPAGARG